MSIMTKWLSNQTQQTVMTRVSVFPVMAKTGPSARSGKKETVVSKTGEGYFVVGESEVGGSDVVGGLSK